MNLPLISWSKLQLFPPFIINDVLGLSCSAFLPTATSSSVYSSLTSTSCVREIRTETEDVTRLLIELALLAADKRKEKGRRRRRRSRDRGEGREQKEYGKPLFWELGQRPETFWSSVVTSQVVYFPPAGKRPMSLARLYTSTLDTPPFRPQTTTHEPPLRTWPVCGASHPIPL